MSTYDDVRRAAEHDVYRIMEIQRGREQWLRETKLSDQWASVAEWKHLLVYLIRRGNVWVIDDEFGVVVGTITVSTEPDRDFWDDEERRLRALYVSKLATDVQLKGQELGGTLLDWARRYAASKGIGLLRLDTWKTSDELCHYYETRGWQHVRLVDLGHRQSGHLFERDTDGAVPLDDGPPTGAFAVVGRRPVPQRVGVRSGR